MKLGEQAHPGDTGHLERAARDQVTKKTSHSQGKKIALTPSSDNKAIELEGENEKRKRPPENSAFQN